MSSIMFRRYLAEFLGTFAYVFFGAGTRILTGNGQDVASRLLVYFTFGFTLLALTYALSHSEKRSSTYNIENKKGTPK